MVQTNEGASSPGPFWGWESKTLDEKVKILTGRETWDPQCPPHVSSGEFLHCLTTTQLNKLLDTAMTTSLRATTAEKDLYYERKRGDRLQQAEDNADIVISGLRANIDEVEQRLLGTGRHNEATPLRYEPQTPEVLEPVAVSSIAVMCDSCPHVDHHWGLRFMPCVAIDCRCGAADDQLKTCVGCGHRKEQHFGDGDSYCYVRACFCREWQSPLEPGGTFNPETGEGRDDSVQRVSGESAAHELPCGRCNHSRSRHGDVVHWDSGCRVAHFSWKCDCVEYKSPTMDEEGPACMDEEVTPGCGRCQHRLEEHLNRICSRPSCLCIVFVDPTVMDESKCSTCGHMMTWHARDGAAITCRLHSCACRGKVEMTVEEFTTCGCGHLDQDHYFSEGGSACSRCTCGHFNPAISVDRAVY